MHVELAVGGALPLNRHLRGALGEVPQVRHVVSCKQLAFIGPALGSGLGPHAQEAAAALKDLQAVAVFDGRDGGRLQRNLAADFQGGRAYVGFADGGRVRGARAATRGEAQERDREADFSYGTHIAHSIYFNNRVEDGPP